MTDTLHLAAALAAGILLGTLFFGGLWWTTRKGLVADNPALWFVGSLIVRSGAVAAGFYFIAGGDWRRAIACLLGFSVARLAVLPLAGTLSHRPAPATERHHEY